MADNGESLTGGMVVAGSSAAAVGSEFDIVTAPGGGKTGAPMVMRARADSTVDTATPAGLVSSALHDCVCVAQKRLCHLLISLTTVPKSPQLCLLDCPPPRAPAATGDSGPAHQDHRAMYDADHRAARVAQLSERRHAGASRRRP